MVRWKLAALLVLALVALRPVGAQEINVFGGYLNDTSSDDSAACYQFEYRQDTGDASALSVSWANEGHLDGDHRDGPLIQVWRRARFSDDRLTVSAGAGPYFWFNTAQDGESGADKTIHHGIGGIISLDATWQASEHWQWLLRGNWITASGEPNTLSLNLGAGYLIDPEEMEGQVAPCDRRDEVTLFAGNAIANAFASDSEAAWGIDYRHAIGSNTDWTVGLLHEDERHVGRGLGLTSQVWAVRQFSQGRWSIGGGAGGYLSITDQDRPNVTDAETLSGLLTITAARRLTDSWNVRFAWNRLLTRNQTDADILLLGFGYCLH
jgi:hypothetical protein